MDQQHELPRKASSMPPKSGISILRDTSRFRNDPFTVCNDPHQGADDPVPPGQDPVTIQEHPVPRLRTSQRAVSIAATIALTATALTVAPLAHAAGEQPLAAPSKAAKTAASTTIATQDAALKTAHTTGKPVSVPGAESATNSLTANPNGTLTLTTYARPVRKQVGGSWRDLDGTLKKNPTTPSRRPSPPSRSPCPAEETRRW